MARKSAALLKDAPVKLPKRSRDYLGLVIGMEVPDGVEDEMRYYYEACVALEEQYVRVDAIGEKVDKLGSNDPNWPAFLAADHRLHQLQKTAFGACDRLRYAIKHLDDPTAVPEADIRATVIDSLADKTELLTFSINSGLLGSKIAQAIRASTSEHSSGEPPFCKDCR